MRALGALLLLSACGPSTSQVTRSKTVVYQADFALVWNAVLATVKADYKDIKFEDATKGTVRQTISLRKGLSQELAKEITKLVRDDNPKLKTQIQGEAVRITGRSKDELQRAIQVLRRAEDERKWTSPLQFNNYR